MHIKFSRHGTGSGKKAAEYLTQDKDHTGELRSEISILRGDPNQVAMVADSLNFKHKYTSGIIAWSPEDMPSKTQINALLDDFEKTAWSGLEPDRYSWSAVLHRENNGACHIHVFAARCDLATGKSLNIAPPGHQKTFDALRDYYNYENNWARPDDPERARVWQPGFRTYIDKAQLKAGLSVESDQRQLITSYLQQEIEIGKIKNRDDIILSLREAGLETPRAGKNYITVKDPETGDKFRLKGDIYNDSFKCSESERSIAKEDGSRPERGREVNRKRAEQSYRELEKYRKERAAYNQSRYKLDGRGDQRISVKGVTRDREDVRDIKGGDNQKMVQDNVDWSGGRPEHLYQHLRWELGPDAISVKPDTVKPDRDRETRTSFEPTSSSNLGVDSQRNSGREFYRSASRDKGSEIHGRGSRSPENRKEINHGTDRDRTDDDRELTEITARADRNNQELDRARQQLRKTSQRLNKRLQQSCEALQRIGEKFMKELSRFKIIINLVEYIASKGFQLDKNKSSKRTSVMRREDEKVLVSTQDNGFGFFVDVRSGKGGTIIDFCQRETGKNLGQVRQELRSFAAMPTPEITYAKPEPKPSKEEQEKKLKEEKEQAERLIQSSYLEFRHIQDMLNDQRFRDRVYTDQYGNVCFPHFNDNGFSGFEKKNFGYSSFTASGEKGLWFSDKPVDCKQIVICESAIDALSHAQLHPDNNAGYVSMAGQLSHEQEKLINELIERNSDKQILLAFDNDEKGHQYANDILERHPGCTVDMPRRKGLDWNDQLQRKVVADKQKQSQIELTKSRDLDMGR